jgi:hypothetical protein
MTASRSPANTLPRSDSVKAGVDTETPARQVENDEYRAFARRLLRAYALRVGDGRAYSVLLSICLARIASP